MKRKKSIINTKNIEVAEELFSYSQDEIFNELMPSTLKKMQDYLVSNGIASKFGDIKKLPRIEIKGIGDNGKERQLGKEVRERFGLDAMEASKKFNTFYPIWPEGIIKYASAWGNHYSHFKVVDQDEKTFDINIIEYIFAHDTFYLTYVVEVKGVSKYEPYYVRNFVGKDVRRIFYDLCNEKKNDFTELEKRIVNGVVSVEQNSEELYIIMNNTIANIRVVNYLSEAFQENESLPIEGSFYNNEFFEIKKWKEGENLLEEIYSKQIQKYLHNLLQPSDEPKILRKNTIEVVINSILEKNDIITFNMAVGFAFQSGLRKLSKIFEATKEGRCRCNLIVGALQHYDQSNAGNRIDKSTVQYLEDMRKNKGVMLYTYVASFYHGKFYYLQDSEYAYIIIGSSNISRAAFSNNYELDCLYIVKKGSSIDRRFFSWFESLKEECIKIKKLDAKNFKNHQWDSELDAYQAFKNKKISLGDIKRRISALTDEETKYRLNLWISHEPVIVYDNIDNEALKAYSMFVFPEQEMVVFESFVPQNAFYVFGCPNGVTDLLMNISAMSKTQMAMSAHFIDRGHHMANQENLKNRINRLFQ